MIVYVEVRGKHQIQKVKDLFGEYARSLDFSLRFQDFEQELEEPPGEYAPPDGCLFLAVDNGNAIGCVGLRSLLGSRWQSLLDLEARPLSGSTDLSALER